MLYHHLGKLNKAKTLFSGPFGKLGGFQVPGLHNNTIMVNPVRETRFERDLVVYHISKQA